MMTVDNWQKFYTLATPNYSRNFGVETLGLARAKQSTTGKAGGIVKAEKVAPR